MQATEPDEAEIMRDTAIRRSGSWLKHQAHANSGKPRPVPPDSLNSTANRSRPVGRALCRSEVLAPAELGVEFRKANRFVQAIGRCMETGAHIYHISAACLQPPQSLAHDGFPQSALSVRRVRANWLERSDAVLFLEPSDAEG